MSRQLFGTDGIRGVAGEPPVDPKTAFALGFALARHIADQNLLPPAASTGERAHQPAHQVLIGMDTRESGPWLAEHVAGGIAAGGLTVAFAGVTTTPAVAYLTRTQKFAAGVMISASHNPYHDNGLKVVGSSGYKLPDAVELELEAMMADWLRSGAATKPISLTPDRQLDHHYALYLRSTVSGSFPFKLVADLANGSAVAVAPDVLTPLLLAVDWLADAPDGKNINLGCGSLHLHNLQQRVVETHADFGVAFDGDADRALFVSSSGKVVDGDAVLFLAGTALQGQGRLAGSLVVSTVMSNLGLEQAFERRGIEMLRTPVGDKYVLEEMRRRGAVLGGEQSGHVIFSEYATTGDGILTALRVLEVVRDSGRTLDELVAEVQNFPQRLVNVRVQRKQPLEQMRTLQVELAAAEQELRGDGRVLVRFSGTEPLARVMVEARTHEQVERWSGRIAAAIRAESGSVN